LEIGDEMKNILITGGYGYIGTNVIGRYNNVCNFHISDYGELVTPAEEYGNLSGFDGVIHLAALSGVIACENNHQKAIKDNLVSANHIFKLATEYRIPVVFTSSGAAKDPQASIYASMKWMIEQLAEYYNSIGGNIHVVRLSNVYGGEFYTKKKKGTCIREFLERYNNNEPMQIHGEGIQVRDFIHVYDVCDALMKILETQPDFKGPIEIGTGIGHTILDIANMFPRKQNQHYVFADCQNIGTLSSIAETETAKKILGFEAKRKVEDYIKESII
jgi:nucleoside-diphosphate-sugar epimerase